MTPRVFVTRRLPGAALTRLAEHADVGVFEEDRPPGQALLLERASRADGLLCLGTDRIDATVLDACPRLRVVANYGVGYDNLDLEALSARGIPASNTPGVLSDATADLTWALILAVARRVVEAHDAVLAGQWSSWKPAWLLGRELAGGVLGIVGLGRIGRAVARRAHGFAMHVIACSASSNPARGAEEVEGAGLVEWVSLDELLGRADVVSLHVPLTPETRHLIGRRELAAMRRSAILINTARGEVVDQAALFDALAAQDIAAAGLDVTDPEPLSPGEAIVALPNCLVLPHIGSATVRAREAMAEVAVDNLIAGLQGERLPCLLNPQAYRA